MANSKRKCKLCGEFELATDGIKTPKGWFCKIDHALEFLTVKRKSERAKALLKTKREDKLKLNRRKEKLKGLSDWNKEAQASINRYIRARDHGKACISCGEISEQKRGGTMEAGHYRSRGSASHLRFNLLNIHLQCSRCNRYLSGNVVEYRKELINRVGVSRVELLENDNTPRKFSVEYLKRVKTIFSKRARFYEKRIAK